MCKPSPEWTLSAHISMFFLHLNVSFAHLDAHSSFDNGSFLELFSSVVQSHGSLVILSNVAVLRLCFPYGINTKFLDIAIINATQALLPV